MFPDRSVFLLPGWTAFCVPAGDRVWRRRRMPCHTSGIGSYHDPRSRTSPACRRPAGSLFRLPPARSYRDLDNATLKADGSFHPPFRPEPARRSLFSRLQCNLVLFGFIDRPRPEVPRRRKGEIIYADGGWRLLFYVSAGSRLPSQHGRPRT